MTRRKRRNNELPNDIQLYIKKWVKENSDKINKNLIEKTKQKL